MSTDETEMAKCPMFLRDGDDGQLQAFIPPSVDTRRLIGPIADKLAADPWMMDAAKTRAGILRERKMPEPVALCIAYLSLATEGNC